MHGRSAVGCSNSMMTAHCTMLISWGTLQGATDELLLWGVLQRTSWEGDKAYGAVERSGKLLVIVKARRLTSVSAI